MEFLYKLYNHPNFGLYLFTTITILAVLFVIVLLLALKDAKKVENLEEKKKEEEDLNNHQNPDYQADIQESVSDFAFTDDTAATPLEIPNEEAFAPSSEETNLDNFTSPQIEDAYNDDIVNDFRISSDYDMPIDDDEDEFKTTILEDINTESYTPQAMNDQPVLEPITEPEISDIFGETSTFEPLKFQAVREEFKPLPDLEPEKEFKKEEPKSPYPTQFSSVYVDRKTEDVMPKPAPEPSPLPSVPSQKEMPEELPKVRHIPTPKPIKLNVNAGEPINNIENETYEIK